MSMVYENKFQIINYNETVSVMDFSWKADVVKKLNDKKYIKEIKVGAELIIKLKPQKILVRYNNFDYPLSPDIQKEINDIILPAYVWAGVKKLAFLKPSDFVEQIAVEQVIKEREYTHTFLSRFFNNEQKAVDWLTEQ